MLGGFPARFQVLRNEFARQSVGEIGGGGRLGRIGGDFENPCHPGGADFDCFVSLRKGLFAAVDRRMLGDMEETNPCGEQTFARREIATEAPAPDGGYFVKGLPNPAEVVVQGAQLLLSEEFRSQIRVGEEGQ